MLYVTQLKQSDKNRLELPTRHKGDTKLHVPSNILCLQLLNVIVCSFCHLLSTTQHSAWSEIIEIKLENNLTSNWSLACYRYHTVLLGPFKATAKRWLDVNNDVESWTESEVLAPISTFDNGSPTKFVDLNCLPATNAEICRSIVTC